MKVDELANLDDVGDEDAGGKREVSLYVARHRFQPLLISELSISNLPWDLPEKGRGGERAPLLSNVASAAADAFTD